ncbi:transmembrane protein 177-like [Oculina patagonica]
MEVAFEKILRSVVRFGIGGLLLVRASSEFFPQIHKEFFGLRDENGVLVKVPDRCREQFAEVARKFGLKNPDKVSLFVNRRFYAFSAGSNLLPGGAVIGLPRWYLYQTKEDVKNSGLQLGEGVSWDSKVGLAVTESFLPTNDMIAFTIGHELAHIDQHLNFKLFFMSVPPLWLYLTYRVARVTPRIFKLHVVFDAVLKLCIFGVNYHAYNLVDRKLTYLAEFDADKISAKCDPQMAQGGIDFFTTTLKRNVIQRALLGEKGKEVYTEEGNDLKNTSISTHPQLTDRLDKVKLINNR